MTKAAEEMMMSNRSRPIIPNPRHKHLVSSDLDGELHSCFVLLCFSSFVFMLFGPEWHRKRG